MKLINFFCCRLNMPILGAMLSKACNRCEFDYILYVMKKTRRIGIRVSEEYLRILDDFDNKVKDILKRKVQYFLWIIPSYFCSLRNFLSLKWVNSPKIVCRSDFHHSRVDPSLKKLVVYINTLKISKTKTSIKFWSENNWVAFHA